MERETTVNLIRRPRPAGKKPAGTRLGAFGRPYEQAAGKGKG